MFTSATLAQGANEWLATKLRNYYPQPPAETVRALTQAVIEGKAPENAPPFDNPFHIPDLLAFDAETLGEIIEHCAYGLSLDELALALHGAPAAVIALAERALLGEQRAHFLARLHEPAASVIVYAAQRHVLDTLFWELTYWETPDLYDQLTEGEYLHPDLFPALAPYLRGSQALDAGAGSGRATFACLREDARHVYAVEPSPGLLRILRRKVAQRGDTAQITPLRGRFDALPLADDSVDVALSCSAFTADSQQGGEPGLAELRRVTRAGGRIILIWPRPEDYGWLAARGFSYVALPVEPGMAVHFRSREVALRVAARFYAHNPAVLRYLRQHFQPDVPFEVLSYNPPHDYCWLLIEK